VAIGQDGPTPDANGKCPPGSKPKYNQTYTLGSATSGKYMYFSTAANGMCNAAIGGYFPKISAWANDDVVCEGNQGWSSRHLGFKLWGDLRRTEVFRVNSDTDQVENVTPSGADAPILDRVFGLRGQGAIDDVVLFGSPVLNATGNGYGGLGMVAFEGSTGKFLGQTILPEYFNIRRGNVIDGDLYFGVRLAGAGAGGGGGVIKWAGSKSDPFKFEVVANNLPSEPGYITGYDHHIITSGFTAPSMTNPSPMAEIYMSPTIPAGGLTEETADPSNWKSIFKMSDYDPDPVISGAVNFGDLIEFDGKLVFSTYIMGGLETLRINKAYGEPTDDIGRLTNAINAERATAVLEMSDVGKPNQKVRLLYGDTTLPVYNAATKRWENRPNNLRQVAKFGQAGFGNRTNFYSWMWEIYKGSLYMSTFDASSMVTGASDVLPDALNLSPETVELLKPVINLLHQVTGGGDVWRFDSLNTPAVPETLDAYGNKNTHGASRSWGAFPEKNKLYAASATWANLNNTTGGRGGWQLNVLKG
jgi:hypothetical protein